MGYQSLFCGTCVDKATEINGFQNPLLKIDGFRGTHANETTAFKRKSWCPDCVTAQPIVEATLEKELKEPANYLYVGVGDRSFWKDPSCIFRTDALTKLKSVPTLFKWDEPGNRLE